MGAPAPEEKEFFNFIFLLFSYVIWEKLIHFTDEEIKTHRV